MCFLHGSQVNGLVFSLERIVHGHLGSPGALGLKTYWFPFGPCPTVGLKSVVSFFILDYRVNTCCLQKIQTILRYRKQKRKSSVSCCLLADQSPENQLNWRIFSQTPSLCKHTLHRCNHTTQNVLNSAFCSLSQPCTEPSLTIHINSTAALYSMVWVYHNSNY